MDFSQIAEGLKLTQLETELAWNTLSEGFMTPDIGPNPELGEGIFARLSARGYMDCTDWDGPFDTEEEAAAHLIETYSDY